MRRLAFLLLLLVASPLSAAGFEVSPPPRGTHPTVSLSAIASNGSGFLAAWRDYATGGIDGVLLDAAGNRITEDAFRILAGSANLRTDYLTPYGSGYALVWNDVSGAANISILDGSGRVLRTIAPQVPARPYSIIAGGGNFFLYGPRGAADLEGFHLDPDGRLIRATDVVLDGVTTLDASYSSGEYLLAATAISGVYLIRTSAAQSHDALIVIEPSPAGSFAISAAGAHAGNNIVVVYSTATTASVPAVTKTALVSAGGITTTTLPYYGFPYIAPRKLVPANDHYVLVLDAGKNDGFESDYLNIAAMRLDAGGAPIDPRPTPVSTSQFKRHVEDVARSSSAFGIVTTENVGTGQRIVGATFRSDSSIRDVREDIISITRASQHSVDVATDGLEFLSVWAESTAETHAIRTQRFDRNGGRVGNPLDLAFGAAELESPRVAAAFGTYFVVWTDGDRVLAHRISAALGTRLEPSPIVIATGNIIGRPNVTTNGSSFFVTWSQNGRIHAAVVANSGSFITPARPLPAAPAPGTLQRDPAAVWDGIQYLVVWTLAPAGLSTPQPTEIRGQLFSAGLLAPSTSDTLLLGGGSDADLARGYAETLLVARRGDGSLAAFFLEASGIPSVIGTPVAIDAGFTTAPSVVYTGLDYAVAYTRSGGQLRLARLGRTSPLTIRSVTAPADGAAALAVTPSGEIAVVVSEFRTEAALPPTLRAVAYLESEIEDPFQPRRRIVIR